MKRECKQHFAINYLHILTFKKIFESFRIESVCHIKLKFLNSIVFIGFWLLFGINGKETVYIYSRCVGRCKHTKMYFDTKNVFWHKKCTLTQKMYFDTKNVFWHKKCILTIKRVSVGGRKCFRLDYVGVLSFSLKCVSECWGKFSILRQLTLRMTRSIRGNGNCL